MAKLSSLVDTFDDTPDYAVKWISSYNTSSIASVSDRLVISTTLNTNYHGLVSNGGYDLTSSYAQIEVIGVGNQQLASFESFPLNIYLSSDNTTGVFWYIHSGIIKAYKKISGTSTILQSATYDASVHRWLRIRENNGTTYFETSPDGVTWTTFTSLANPITMTSLTLEISAGTYSTESTITSITLDNLNVLPTAPYLQKKYVYKVYHQGVYIGMLPNVISEFEYTQLINTTGAQITISVGMSADTASQAPAHILTESGDYMTDESGNRLVTERVMDLVGNSDSSILINNGNEIYVYEYSDLYPNGKKIFSGQINRWEAGFGDNGDEKVDVYVISDGADLDNYIYGTNNFTLQISQTAHDTWLNIDPSGFPGIGQTFVPATSFIASKIAIWASAGGSVSSASSVTLTLKLYSGVPNGSYTLLDSASATITNQYPTLQEVEFIFSGGNTLTSGGNYFIAVFSNTYAAIGVSNPPPDNYTSGTVIVAYSSTTFSGPSSGGQDMYFKIYSSTAVVTTAVFTSYDPAQMIKDAVTDYLSRGGSISYSGSSIDMTSESVSYTFISATVYEVIKKALELSPSDWYFYVDVGSDVLYFKERATTAKYTIIKGRHLNNIKIAATIENVKNTDYFTGGLVSGSNLYTKYIDATSVANYGQKLSRESDNRVTTTATADILGNAFIAKNKDEQYHTEVTIIDGLGIDTTSVKLGDMIGFSGFGTFVDKLLLQVVQLTYNAQGVQLTLGTPTKKLTTAVEEAIRDINLLETVANPSSPS
jgi:hypothetical protein